jgi:DNA-binding NtrC family response regulator
MGPIPNGAPTATAAADALENSAEEQRLATLRWVWPFENQVTVLSANPALLGRDAGAATQLDTPQVSRRHAEVRLGKRSCSVVDLGSKNGVFVNGVRASKAELAEGDVLRLGDCVAVLEFVTPVGLPGFGSLHPGILGGAALREVVSRAQRVAESPLNVLILGETGTGKECFARALHAFSGRTGPFLAVNCATYDENTASAELFGYKKGAFTGAEVSSPGHVRAAHGGTLFLDELPELSLGIQAKLLRAIEQREVLSLGETQPRPVDVRFLCASQAPLAQAVAAGRFRADLRARLEGSVLELPSLCLRRADIVPLFRELLLRHGFEQKPKLEPKLVERLSLYDWPLNVRELENLARRVVSEHANEPELTLERLRDVLRFDEPLASPPDAAGPFAARRAAPAYSSEELSALAEALERHGGNLTRAADELGITRPKAYRMLRAQRTPG